MQSARSRQDEAKRDGGPVVVNYRPAGAAARPRVIVLGNEKGGSGKSTTAMHVTVALLQQGHSVGCIDLDARQGTLSRYAENRRAFAEKSGLPLALPPVRRVGAARSAMREHRASVATPSGGPLRPTGGRALRPAWPASRRP